MTLFENILVDLESEVMEKLKLYKQKVDNINPHNLNVQFVEQIRFRNDKGGFAVLKHCCSIDKISDGFSLKIWDKENTPAIIKALEELGLFIVTRVGDNGLSLKSRPITISQIKRVVNEIDTFLHDGKEFIRHTRNIFINHLKKFEKTVSKDDIDMKKSSIESICKKFTDELHSYINIVKNRIINENKR